MIPQLVEATENPVEVIIDGRQVELPFIIQDGVSYVSLRELVSELDGTVIWNEDLKQINLYSKYGQEMIIDLKRNRIFKESLWRNISLLLEEGRTYYPLREITNLLGMQVDWDDIEKQIHIFTLVRYTPSQSIVEEMLFHDFSFEGNQVNYSLNGAQLTMELNGDIKDIQLLEQSEQSDMMERRYGLFWEIEEEHLAHIVLTVRQLPDGNTIIFTEGYSPIDVTLKQFVKVEDHSKLAHYYLGDFFIHQERGEMRKLIKSSPVEIEIEVEVAVEVESGNSYSWFFIQGEEDLTLRQQEQVEILNRSKHAHRSVWWLTPRGSNRGVTEEYLNDWEIRLFFYNLQATTPTLIMDSYKQNTHPLFKAILDNAAFTLMIIQGEDGFWRTPPNVAYLNRAFSLGEEFIDTRLSADAAIFLTNYYELFGGEEVLHKATQFTNYFLLHDQRNDIYKLGEGRLYPDYFAERQRIKSLVSLNHALHEVNYLLILAEVTNNPEYLYQAKLMLEGIQASEQDWVDSDGDLYYALNYRGEYYAKDYVFITYRDLLVTKGLLLRHGLSYPSIDNLFAQKHAYLQQDIYPDFEADLSFKKVYDTFILNKPVLGSMFLATSLDIQKEWDSKHYAIGAFHWLTGISQLEELGHTLALNPTQKYVIVDLKDSLIILDSYPSDIRLDDNGGIIIENGDRENKLILLTPGSRITEKLMPEEIYIVKE